MADLPAFLMPHRVSVETYQGDTGTDDTYAAAVANIPCRQEGAILVTSDGHYVGSAKLFLRLEHRELFRRESRVTLQNGGVGHVQAVADHSDAGAGAWEHLEVAVQ